jgi:hypothetical protein
LKKNIPKLESVVHTLYNTNRKTNELIKYSKKILDFNEYDCIINLYNCINNIDNSVINIKNIIDEYNDILNKKKSINYEKYSEQNQLKNIYEYKKWSYVLFLKIVKNKNNKIYGEVIDWLYSKDTQILKIGDIISFKKHEILFFPSDMNNSAKYNKYLIRKIEYYGFNSPVLTDWNGRILDKSIINLLELDNIVRIQFRVKYGEITINTLYYVKILSIKDDKYYGIIQDYYLMNYNYKESEMIYDRSIDDIMGYPISPGIVVKFNKNSIMEVPIDWNDNLKNLKNIYPKGDVGRGCTGFIFGIDEEYYKLN